MPSQLKDTIAAIATPIGEGGIGVIRLSGQDSVEHANKIFSSNNKKVVLEQDSHTVRYGVIHQQDDAATHLDDVLLLVLRAPRSYTGEDTVEISCHGGRLILQNILDLCLSVGCRLAEPGEFTKRAFLNGRLDLIQAENVIDVIQAKSEQSLKIARSHLEGKLSKRILSIRDELKDVLSHIEADLDFSEDDINPQSLPALANRINASKKDITSLIDSANTGLMVQRGMVAVLTGRPNVGKSSLMNALLDKKRVIVSDQPGTTRDSVEADIELSGYPIRLIDTAGIRVSEDSIESESVERAGNEVQKSDLIIFVIDGSRELHAEELNQFKSFEKRQKLVVVNKSDCKMAMTQKGLTELFGDTPMVYASAIEAQGQEELKKSILSFLKQPFNELPEELWIHSVRQLNLLRSANDHLSCAMQSFEKNNSLEFPASDIRLAMNALGEIVGEVVTDDILDVIFGRFCIGK